MFSIYNQKVTSENRMRWSLLLNTEDSPENRGDCVDFCNDSSKQQKGCSSFKDALKSSGFDIFFYLNEMRDQYVERLEVGGFRRNNLGI